MKPLTNSHPFSGKIYKSSFHPEGKCIWMPSQFHTVSTLQDLFIYDNYYQIAEKMCLLDDGDPYDHALRNV